MSGPESPEISEAGSNRHCRQSNPSKPGTRSMSRRANPKIVGGFVLAAIGLLVAAALVFGTFTFFEVTRRFVVFFQGSVDGLAQGSAVLFRGVPLGRVIDVGIRFDPQNRTFQIPVVIDIRPGVIGRLSPEAKPDVELIQ